MKLYGIATFIVLEFFQLISSAPSDSYGKQENVNDNYSEKTNSDSDKSSYKSSSSPKCPTDGLVYSEYELIDNSICIKGSEGGYGSRNCYPIDKSVTTFYDYPYSYPSSYSGIQKRKCTINRNAEYGPSVVCETFEDTTCEDINANRCEYFKDLSPYYLYDDEICKCTKQGYSLSPVCTPALGEQNRAYSPTTNPYQQTTTTTNPYQPTTTTTNPYQPTTSSYPPNVNCPNYGYSYYEYKLTNKGVCYLKDKYSNKWVCFNMENSVKTFVDYPYAYPNKATGMKKRTCKINRSKNVKQPVKCTTEKYAICEPINKVNPCSTMKSYIPYIFKNK
ncbi:hypothetical protein BB560_005006, partial [Smittium megazygosporum]